MTTANTIEANHSDLTIFIEELTSSSGVRAVSAWQALSKQDAAYALDDEEAPYEFRHAVGSDIGWENALSPRRLRGSGCSRRPRL